MPIGTGAPAVISSAIIRNVSAMAGALSDTFSKRNVMLVSQSLMAFFAVVMGVTVLSGHMELWHMYALAFLSGTAAAFDAPARQAFVSEMVPQDKLTNAVGLNSASFHSGRLIGPARAKGPHKGPFFRLAEMIHFGPATSMTPQAKRLFSGGAAPPPQRRARPSAAKRWLTAVNRIALARMPKAR